MVLSQTAYVLSAYAGLWLRQYRLNSFSFLLFLSLLLHGLFVAAVLWQQPHFRRPQPQPVPLQVFTIASATVRPASIATAAEIVAPPPVVTAPVPAAVPAPKPGIAKPVRSRAARVPHPAALPDAAPAMVNVPHSTAAPAASSPPPELDLSQVLSSAHHAGARRTLTASELAAMTVAPANRDNTSPQDQLRRPQRKPGADPASDVLETLPDGSQLVKIGKQCVLAAPGADLRKDIHSMKVVGCGAGGRTEQDRIDAHFEQVMSTLGQHR